MLGADGWVLLDAWLGRYRLDSHAFSGGLSELPLGRYGAVAPPVGIERDAECGVSLGYVVSLHCARRDDWGASRGHSLNSTAYTSNVVWVTITSSKHKYHPPI